MIFDILWILPNNTPGKTQNNWRGKEDHWNSATGGTKRPYNHPWSGSKTLQWEGSVGNSGLVAYMQDSWSRGFVASSGLCNVSLYF